MSSIVTTRPAIFVINVVRLFERTQIYKIIFLVYWTLLTQSNIICDLFELWSNGRTIYDF